MESDFTIELLEMCMLAVAEWRIRHTRICKYANILIYWAPNLCIVSEYTSVSIESRCKLAHVIVI